LFDYVVENNLLANTSMVDAGGHQLAHIRYPNLPPEEIMDAVHKFYDEYYFRPKAIYRIVRKAAFDSTERKRLYHEAKSFLKLRAQRKKYVKDTRETAQDAPVTAAGD
jgi:hypothetical protein